MLRILALPIFYYIMIFLFFGLYILFRWKNESNKRNLLTVLFCLILLFQISQLAPMMNSRHLLDAFYADTIILKNETIDITVDLEEIFRGEYGIIMDKESLISRIQNLNEKHYLKLFFYKDGKLSLRMKMYKLGESNIYSGDINGTPVEVRWHGFRIKYHDEFYRNIGEVLNGRLN
ncbi:MAG: hypothetical protein COA82_11240 [Alkaliphilus sp.]|nr:hypothetical protein [bacterium AH-315-G05]MBN4074492.1 hypothetical protein [bacterium AH-315-E09]PHS30629.1 MAG: hypothetical protein COA82_11240 [Alkaliphilus sp.]